MNNPLENAFYAVVGLAISSKDKVEEAARKFAADRQMSVDEGKKFVNDIVAQAEANRLELNIKIEDITKNLVGQMGLVSQSEVDSLKSRITELEAELKKVKGS
jgi:polyhydroxyalkanoate synthesis regulator phasin